MEIRPRAPQVGPFLHTLYGGHDLIMPTTRSFRRTLFCEVSHAVLQIEPELWTEYERHERLADRAKPRSNAPCQSAAEAGCVGPLAKASSTHF